MRIKFLALLALPFLFSLPAFAEETVETTTTTTTAPADSAVVEQHMQRQQYREEMQRIRAEHEQLESERDTLKATCMNAKGQDHTDCLRKWSEWHQKRDALHQRMQNLHQHAAATDPEWAARHRVVKHVAPGTVTTQPGGTAPPPPAE